MSTEVYVENAEWDLIDYGAYNGYDEFANLEDVIPIIHFYVVLARKPTYFILNVVTPRYD